MNEPAKTGRVVLRARRLPRHVRIEVEDDGPGLPSPDALPDFHTRMAPWKAICRPIPCDAPVTSTLSPASSRRMSRLPSGRIRIREASRRVR